MKHDDYDLDLAIAKHVFGYQGNIRCPGLAMSAPPNEYHNDKPVIGADGDLYFLRKYCNKLRKLYENIDKKNRPTK